MARIDDEKETEETEQTEAKADRCGEAGSEGTQGEVPVDLHQRQTSPSQTRTADQRDASRRIHQGQR